MQDLRTSQHKTAVVLQEGIAQRSCLACVIPVGWVKTAEGHPYARMPNG
ncbi:hypothetical protein GALL_229880 [mine drainage metagenome]|uniref:Uncharacterized protein n=1 Tax=mine drainage metagenome TaxID=410659 RepID=A0A1J5RG22_9ZZZZ